MIVSEFSMGNVLSPGSRVGAAEDPKISFHLLVNMFSFSISLRVISSGEGEFVAKKFSQFSGEGRSELWSVIRDNLIIETKPFEDFREEQGGDSGGVDGFLGGAENHPLSKPMVDHDQKGIKTVREGKVGDQIAGDLLKGTGAGRWDGEKWGSGWVSIDLVLLERSTAPDVTVDVGGEAQPPKLGSNKLASLENTGMTRYGMIMVVSDDRMAEVGFSWDINAALVS